jgi:hypothetical protein
VTAPDDDPIVRGLKSLHEDETARATRDLARSSQRLSAPAIRTSLPRLLPIGVAVLIVGLVASAVFVGNGSRLGQLTTAPRSPLASAVAASGPPASPGDSVTTSPTSSSVPSADPSSSPQHAQSVQGQFRLDFELPKTIWTAGEPVEGLATLSLVDGTSADIGTSGAGPMAFAYVDPNGKHDVEPAWTSDCRSTQLNSDKPMTSGLSKSGGFSADDPDAAFFRAFLNGDPIVRLPPGDWTITANAHFVEEAGCTGKVHLMTASIPIHVLPSADGQWHAPMPSPTPDASLVADSVDGISFERPVSWTRMQPNAFNPINDGPLIYLSTDPLLPECATALGQPRKSPDSQGRACDPPLASLSTNGVLVTWRSTRILEPITDTNRDPTASPLITIDGIDTALHVGFPGTCAAVGGDETITATIPIGQPTPVSNLAVVTCLRGPDTATAESQLRAMLESTTVRR